ncbi:MAG TPA: hypothetical protein VEC06_10685 [Paucimonas sp.]|nr:hypothetical protein [Paucimonas sp.]
MHDGNPQPSLVCCPDAPPAEERFCRLFAETAGILGVPVAAAAPVTRQWLLSFDGQAFSIIVKEAASDAGVIIVQDFGIVPENDACSVGMRMHHLNFNNCLGGRRRSFPLFSVDPNTQSAVLMEYLELEALNGVLLLYRIREMAAFARTFGQT